LGDFNPLKDKPSTAVYARIYRSLSLVPGTLLKELGSYNLVQNRGHKGPVLRPRCIRPGEGPYPNYDSILVWFQEYNEVR